MKGIGDGCRSEEGEVGGMMYGTDYDDRILNYELQKELDFI